MTDYTDAQRDEIDRLVAEKVMGWQIRVLPTVDRQGERGKHPAWWPGPHRFIWAENWRPTRDRGQALLVFEQCKGMALSNVRHWGGNQPFAVFIDDSMPETPIFEHPGLCEADAPTPMLAICLSALARAGVEVPGE